MPANEKPMKEKAVKDYVLDVLESNRGGHISGARIAAALQVSRAAVWKAIEELREDGYAISAATKRGYILSEGSDLLSPQGIAAHLRHRELADRIFVYDTLESTNLTAKQIALSGAAHGSVVVARTQTAGRGRLGRSFFSPKDSGVYFSIILRPDFVNAESGIPLNPVLLTTAAAVAISRAIEETSGRHVEIKWVNDLYLDGKKVCGILSEGITNFETGIIESIVIGAGINCFKPEENFPDELVTQAASLFSTTPADAVSPAPASVPSVPSVPSGFSKKALVAAAVDHLMDIQNELASGSFMEEYRRRSCVLGKEILFYPCGIPTGSGLSHTVADSDGGAGNRGTAVDIDEQGGLVVQLPDGSRKTLSTGEISIRTIDRSID